MTTYSMPSTPDFSACKFGLVTNAKTFQSPLNFSAQTVEYSGSIWVAEYSLPPMRREDAAAWVAFLVKLRGVAGRFYGMDPSGRVPRGTATGTPLVAGASQTGTSLATDGWTAGVTGILKAGDYISVNSQLYMVTADANSDVGGAATLTIEPPLRSSPSDNAPITTTSATCVMRLADNDQSAWNVSGAMIYGLSFSAVESFT